MSMKSSFHIFVPSECSRISRRKLNYAHTGERIVGFSTIPRIPELFHFYTEKVGPAHPLQNRGCRLVVFCSVIKRFRLGFLVMHIPPSYLLCCNVNVREVVLVTPKQTTKCAVDEMRALQRGNPFPLR